MTFGQFKSYIEQDFLNSYLKENEFKTSIKEFNKILKADKTFTKLYYLYDQLSENKGLTKEEATEVLNEGIKMIKKELTTLNLPDLFLENFNNRYKDIDNLVYENNLDIVENVKSKKNIIGSLMLEKKNHTNQVSLPIDSMIKVGNQVVLNYLSELTEDVKLDLVDILSESHETLSHKFENLKSETLTKIKGLMGGDCTNDIKVKLQETITKIKGEEFSKLNYVRLRDLNQSL